MDERKILAIINGGMKFYAITVVAVAMLTACTNDGAGEVMNHETAEVRMTFSPYDVEPMMRAAVADYATRLDVWVYEGGTEVQAVHQQSTDDGFASLSVRLEKAKTYTVYACAHKAAGAATLSNGVVAWPDDKVTHSFFYSQTFSPATTTTLNCLMERIVGNFRLEIADKVPEGVAYVSVLLPPVVEVLERYGMQAPKIGNADYNHALKAIQMATGITTRLHSHLARHSFATWMLRNGVAMESLAKMMGHTTTRETQKYAKVTAQMVHEDFGRVARLFENDNKPQ